MEFLLLVIVTAVLALSANSIADRKMKSRYDPVPKPPVSISRSYKEHVSGTADKTEPKVKWPARVLRKKSSL